MPVFNEKTPKISIDGVIETADVSDEQYAVMRLLTAPHQKERVSIVAGMFAVDVYFFLD